MNCRIRTTSASVASRISIACDDSPLSRFVVHVTPEMILHSRILDAIYFAGFFYSCAVLLVILKSGISARVRDVAARVSKWRFVTAVIYFALFSLITTAFEFPLAFYAGFVVPHQFALTHQ